MGQSPIINPSETPIKEGERLQNDRVAAAYAQHVNTVMRAAWHYTGSRETAEDCAQEAFLRLMQQDDDMSDGHILPWLLRTAVNLAKDHLKSAEYTRTEALTEQTEQIAGDGIFSAERTVARALKKIPEHYRLPLYLHVVEGYTVRETASLLKLHFGTAATAIRRGKKLLRQAFEEEEL